MNSDTPQYDPTSTHNVFYHLLKDLEDFIDADQIELVFTRDRQVFVQGAGFKEPLTAQANLQREIRQQMREILLRHYGKQNLPD